MEPFANNAAFSTYAICSTLLALKMIASAFYTTSRRMKHSVYVNPEDAQRFGKGADAVAEESPETARALRIQRNDLENIPLFWIVGLLYVLLGASPLGAAVYGWTFTGARFLHTIVYMRGIQPARALLFGLGVLCVLGMSVQVLLHAV